MGKAGQYSKFKNVYISIVMNTLKEIKLGHLMGRDLGVLWNRQTGKNEWSAGTTCAKSVKDCFPGRETDRAAS